MKQLLSYNPGDELWVQIEHQPARHMVLTRPLYVQPPDADEAASHAFRITVGPRLALPTVEITARDLILERVKLRKWSDSDSR
jgi:hypothetical protein